MESQKKRKRASARAKVVEPKSEGLAGDDRADAEFRFLLFADLHVNNNSLKTTLTVMDRIGELAEQHNATPVCTGDFWDLRGHWLVRHVDEVYKRIEQWRPSIFIPGNHDQVSLDGSIHGLCIFRGFGDHQVVTEPLFDMGKRIAFLPWREVPADQRALFGSLGNLPGASKWTVFAHAEVGGAISNGGHKTPGIVQVADIERHARACYLGHYHKRQKLGHATWYIGSPYQQNMAERDWPHGVALVTNESVEPTWIEIEGLPKYWRLSADEDFDASQIGADDIVELIAPVDELGTDSFKDLVKSIPAGDVRPVASKGAGQSSEPTFALTLDAAVEQYSEMVCSNVDFDADVVLATGREILGETPEARAIAPLGTAVSLKRLTTKDFCALRGDLVFEVDGIGAAFIQAPIRTGKTALLDAVTWCLYGETSPRKAGAQGATLRADAVIHDAAADCSAQCVLSVTLRNGETTEVTVTRMKKRGQGAKVSIEGIEYPDGISDQESLVRHVTGLSYAMWRSTVSLGQGAVASFATDGDKQRKDLFSGAFGLDACPKAQKIAKDRRDKAKVAHEKASRDEVAAQAAMQALQDQDFTEQIESWEKRKQESAEASHKAAAAAQQEVERLDEILLGEATWLETKAKHTESVETCTVKLASLRQTVKLAELQQQKGACDAEVAIVERNLRRVRERHEKLIATAVAMCDECGQTIPDDQREQHIEASEMALSSALQEVDTLTHRGQNLGAEIDRLQHSGGAEQVAIEQSIKESREAIEMCQKALSNFAVARSKRETALADKSRADRKEKEDLAAENPFRAQEIKAKEKIASYAQAMQGASALRENAEQNVSLFDLWATGFGPKGMPAMVLRSALSDLEALANKYLSEFLGGTVHCKMAMEDDSLDIEYYEVCPDGEMRQREYSQLSGGQRRCAEMSFAPFALGDMLFARCGTRVNLLLVDELTTHMGNAEKARACDLLSRSDRSTVLVVDHDVSVQGHFDTVFSLQRSGDNMRLEQV